MWIIYNTQTNIFNSLCCFSSKRNGKCDVTCVERTLKVCMHIALNIQLGNQKRALRCTQFYFLKNRADENKRIFVLWQQFWQKKVLQFCAIYFIRIISVFLFLLRNIFLQDYASSLWRKWNILELKVAHFRFQSIFQVSN